MKEKYRQVALYLGWEYVSKFGWYNGLYHICCNHHQLESSLSLEFLFRAVEKLEKEDVKFGHSWEDMYGNIFWNNVGIVFSMFQGTMDFCMERQLDPSKTISERKINYKTLKEDLVEMICETLNYLENVRTINSDIRNAAEKVVKDSNDRIEELEYFIKDLEDKIENLEEEIDENRTKDLENRH